MAFQPGHKIYTDELSRFQHGLAMWYPERQIKVGDVGYIDKGSGAFLCLFNALADPENSMEGSPDDSGVPTVPPNFKPLKIHDKLRESVEACVPDGFLKSSAKCQVTMSNTLGNASTGGKMEFSVSTDKDRGAVLFLGKPANADRVMDNDAFKSYMFDNHRDWITFAKDTFSVTLKPDQLLFVNATTTTDSHWATVAWSSSSRSQKVEYNAESPSVSSSIVNVKVKYNKTTVAEVPFSRSRTDIKRSTVKDHCIFISGYKMKHRLFKSGFKVEAAAGAHNLSDNDDDDEDLSSGYSPNLNPLEAVLDYIIKHSKADIAITSASDISAFYRGSDWPEDVAADLASRQPEVETSRDRKYAYLSMTAVVKNNFAARQRERAEKCTNYIATNEDFKLGGVDARTQSLIDDATILLPGASAPRQWQSRVLLDPTMGGGAPGVTSLSKDGLFFGMAVEDDTIRGWNLDMDLMVYKLDGDMEGMTTVSCFSPDGKSFVSTVGSLVDIWDLSQGKQSGKIEYSELVTGVAWSPNGLLIATTSSNEINIWDGEGDHENLLKIPTIEALSMVQSVTFTPDSTKLIVNSEKQVFIWDVKTGDFIGKLQGHENVIWGLDVSQDSGRIVTGSEDHSCRVWKAATGDELVTMHYHTGPVWSVAFSPDGKRVVSGSHDTITVISDAYTGEKIYALSTKTSTVINSVAYSLDGDVVITGSADGSVRVWDARRGKFEAELRGHEDKVRTLLFTPDGKDFISCSDDGTVRVWNLADILRFAI